MLNGHKCIIKYGDYVHVNIFLFKKKSDQTVLNICFFWPINTNVHNYTNSDNIGYNSGKPM